jgi:protein archease
MAQIEKRWRREGRTDAYRELEHPADLFLEIYGGNPPELLENALFAFYDHVAEIQGFDTRRELTLRVREPSLGGALRSLMSEALYFFDTERFVAVGGEVEIEPAAASTGERSAPASWTAAVDPIAASDWQVVARLWGENADRDRHILLSEVKAVTYHRLAVERAADGGWRATVLLDV